MTRGIRWAVAASTVALVALTGCSDDDGGGDGTTAAPTAAPAAAPTASAVSIQNFAFQVPDGLKAGEPITVNNFDGARHTFTDSGNAFSVAVDGDGSATVTIDEPGTYSVFCEIHRSMTGSITVV